MYQVDDNSTVHRLNANDFEKDLIGIAKGLFGGMCFFPKPIWMSGNRVRNQVSIA
jgi:hypothetical protein